LAYQFRFQNIE